MGSLTSPSSRPLVERTPLYSSAEGRGASGRSGWRQRTLRMLSFRTALICLVVALALAVACHPRVFFGNGSTAFVSLDRVFLAGQWAALFLSLAAFLVSWLASRGSAEQARAAGEVALPAVSALLVVYLLFAGVPHPQNSSEWRNGEMGVAAWLRAAARQAKANAGPTIVGAETFAGSWSAPGGALYAFHPDKVSWTGGAGSGELSAAVCGADFSLRYVQKGREALQDLGLTWSTHAFDVHQATAQDAVIPVAEVACGSEHFVFIRASTDEVWRWSNSLDANDLKNDSFILRANSTGR
jgi:hypothetical protein